MTATINASSLSASGICSGLLTFAKSTLTPFCNMGVITIKMINSTSITSTIGVTLTSELTLAPSFRLLIAITQFSLRVVLATLINQVSTLGRDAAPKLSSDAGQQLEVEKRSSSELGPAHAPTL